MYCMFKKTHFQIAENLWAIGTSPYAIDVQNYISVGQQMFAFNTELNGLLQNHCTYYVTIQSINEAGLSAFNSSEGNLLINLLYSF